jgi:hypothetical protein
MLGDAYFPASFLRWLLRKPHPTRVAHSRISLREICGDPSRIPLREICEDPNSRISLREIHVFQTAPFCSAEIAVKRCNRQIETITYDEGEFLSSSIVSLTNNRVHRSYGNDF